MSDLISREKAIDALSILDISDGVGISCIASGVQYSAIRAIEDLPSAETEIIYCKDCKHFRRYECMDSLPSEMCDRMQTFYDADVDYCSLAERRTDETN